MKTDTSAQEEIDLAAPTENVTMTAREAAQFVLSYAKKHRILRTSADDDADDSDYSAAEFSRSRRNFESQNVLDALRSREINFVGYDEARKRVLIFTKRKVTRQIQKILPSSIERQINIEYYEGGIASVRGAPQESFRPQPYTFTNSKFLLPIHDGHPDNIAIENNLDAACFVISDETRVSSMQGEFFDTPPTCAPLQVGMRVEKVGRTTGLTTGEVTIIYEQRRGHCGSCARAASVARVPCCAR